jgi:hypothetical protein
MVHEIFDGFERLTIAADVSRVALVRRGDGPGLPLPHGFPQNAPHVA